MAADIGTEVHLEEGSQSSSKRQVETSKSGLSETGITPFSDRDTEKLNF